MLKPYEIGVINNAVIYISPHPDGGFGLQDDLKLYLNNGDLLVSHLTQNEVIVLQLEHVDKVCSDNGFNFKSYAIPDGDIPDIDNYILFIRYLYTQTLSGKKIMIHCWGGAGRSALTAISLYVLHGLSFNIALTLVREKREYEVPQTQKQYKFLEMLYEDKLLSI